jgi:hypothetical protein
MNALKSAFVPRLAGRRKRSVPVAAVALVLGLSGSVVRAPVAHAVEPAASGPGIIGFDLCDLDAQGLVGPPDGKRAVDYELCIPRGDAFLAEVGAIDASARFFPDAPGRIGCGPDEVLVIGNTHRPDFAFVLQRLAELPYVRRIERAWFE